jgi:cyclic-di-GMP-binding protein
MMDEAKLKTWLERIKLPERDLDELSFCASSKAAKVGDWVQGLPMTRISYVCSLLYQALPEVARLKVAPEQRIEMLELLRPAVHQAIESLSQQFLNQPVILPEPARKAATVAQALQKHLSNAYLVAVSDFGHTFKDSTEGADPRTLAIHRSITGLGLLLLRSYQLYTPRPAQLWNELHALYALAEEAQLHQHPIHDPLPHHEGLNTIQLTYVRLLLLACAHPNQLRQEEITTTYWALEELSPLARLMAFTPGQKDSLYAVALDGNQPPQYTSRLPGGVHNLRELDTHQIVVALSAEKPPGGRTARNRYGLLLPLNEHLIRSWNIVSQRSFERQPGRGQVELTVGLTNLHYHLAGQVPFKLFLNQESGVHEDDTSPFGEQRAESEEGDDPWGSAFDVGKTRLAGSNLPSINIERTIKERQKEKYQGEHPTYAIPIIDSSLGGYCLEWREQIPSQVKAGELLGIREEGRRKWSLAVVRWMQQTRNATLLGLQILAPQAVPLAAAVVLKTGAKSEFLRVLQVPPLKAINQPATLITNALSFHEYGKVRLYRPSDALESDTTRAEMTIQLTRRRFSTGAISQFEFRELTASPTRQEPGDDF